MERIEIMDVTVRDGSYLSQAYFTIKNIHNLVGQLHSAGIRRVEVGHGFGLGAERIMEPMPCSDLECITSLCHAYPDVRFGAFAFPTLATPEDLAAAARAGLNFVRVGTFGHDSEFNPIKALSLIEHAKQEGLWASLNLVRTQFLSDKTLKELTLDAAHCGADCIYIVDSTGGALPDGVYRQVSLVKDCAGIQVGFHGHDNLRIAASNSLEAARAGATIIDGTVQGVGRDAGNTQIDILNALLTKADFDTGVSTEALSSVTLTGSLGVFGVSRDNVELGFLDLMTHGLPLVREVAAKFETSSREVAIAFRDSGSTFETMENLCVAAQKCTGKLLNMSDSADPGLQAVIGAR